MAEEISCPFFLSSAILESDQGLDIVLEEAEKALLQGQFQRAFKDANHYLFHSLNRSTNASSKTETGEVQEDVRIIYAPLHFPFLLVDAIQRQLKRGISRREPLSIRIELQSSDAVDRAAAVALQSWYEVSKRLSEEAQVVQERHLFILQSFWKMYTSASILENSSRVRSCSFELVILLIQFYQATRHSHEAFELSLVTLDHVISNYDSLKLLSDRYQLYLIQELLMYFLCQFLPFLDERSVEHGLNQLSGRVTGDHSWRKSKFRVEEGQLATQINLKSSRRILHFLENSPVHWPDECKRTLKSCQENVECILRSNLSDFNEKDLYPLLSDTSKQVSVKEKDVSVMFEGLPTNGYDGSLQLWFYRLAHLVRKSMVEPISLSERRRWNYRIQAIFTLCTIWTAWKHRNRISSLSKGLVHAIVKPLREIIEALVLMTS